LVFPLWYQGFIALIGSSVLAGVTLVSLRQRGYLRTYRLAATVSVGFSLALIFSYYTTMHGDRPRWKDAVQFVQTQTGLAQGSTAGPGIYGEAGIVAFYLEEKVSPAGPHRLVRGQFPERPLEFPERPLDRPPVQPEWVIVLQSQVSEVRAKWLAATCELARTFGAWTGPRNRTILVYRCPPE
jgi:hypothetical protein